MINFLDTSAILNGAIKHYENIYISPLVISELENIKTSDRNENIKYLARQAVRDILIHPQIKNIFPNQKQVKKELKKFNFLSEINDHYLLMEALLLQKKGSREVNFITSDGSLYLFAQKINRFSATYFDISILNPQQKIEYCGWKKCYPTNDELVTLYSDLSNNVLNCKINEFAEIFEDDKLKDVLFWDGEKYNNLKYQTFKGYLGEKIAPRNIEQKMLFHLLQNDNIKIKLCLGGFGDGKTWSMLQHALKGVKDGRFSKIIYVRNNIITKGSRDIGFLSGSLIDKIKPYILPIADLTTPEYLNELIETGILEPVPLAFMRGRDFSGDILVFCDEAENLTKENVQLLIGRIGERSQLWFAGDLKQIDHYDFEKNNGIKKMIECLSREKLFGMVKLIKSERSKTSQLADLMD